MASVPGEPAQADVKSWTDRTGKFRTKAIFVGLRDGKVSLKKKNEKVIVVPLDVLSEKDREWSDLERLDWPEATISEG